MRYIVGSLFNVFKSVFVVVVLLILFICLSQISGCSRSENNVPNNINEALPWWGSVEPILIDGDEFFGGPCSVTRVRSNDDEIKLATIIFNVPSKLFTVCAQAQLNKNYLKYDGEYIVLHVDRQTIGAGSWTAERYRSKDFKSWEQYIGVTWRNNEEYEAWRDLGSTSSKADSRTKVVRE